MKIFNCGQPIHTLQILQFQTEEELTRLQMRKELLQVPQLPSLSLQTYYYIRLNRQVLNQDIEKQQEKYLIL